MAIISCPECGKQVSDRAASCPECGCPISAAPVLAPQVDTAKEVGKLLVLARRAREASDNTSAKRYYDQILDKDPGNWEAIFYSIYHEAVECKIMYIASAANSIANCIYSTFSAISDLKDEFEQNEAIETVIASACTAAIMLSSGAISHYNKFSTTDNAYSECAGRVVSAGNIYGEIESNLKKVFPEKKERLANFQKLYIVFMKDNKRWYNDFYFNSSVDRMVDEIAEVDPDYAKKRELEKKIANLNTEINGIVTTRTATSGCLGYFFLIVGCIMLFVSMALYSMTEEYWGILVAIPELLIAMVCLKKKPSEEVITANIARQKKLIEERDALQTELDAL